LAKTLKTNKDAKTHRENEKIQCGGCDKTAKEGTRKKKKRSQANEKKKKTVKNTGVSGKPLFTKFQSR